jgi:hypothetical protein
MNKATLVILFCLAATLSAADDSGVTSPTVRPRAVPVGAAHAVTDAEEAAAAPAVAIGQTPPRFSTAEKWTLAGYNNNEVVYTIIVSNEDTRILHCTTLMTGWYYENGAKLSISDRQSTTVLPDQPTAVGNWMDLDQKSGTTYTVKCRPV